MTDTTYNGWTNYETWNYKLWMDQGGTDYWLSQAKDIATETESDDTFTAIENTAFILADQLKAECEEAAEEWMTDQASPFADLLNSSLSAINWHEIATSILDDLDLAA